MYRSIAFISILLLTTSQPTTDTPAPKTIELSPDQSAVVYDMGVAIQEIPNPKKSGKTYEATALFHGTLDQAYAALSNYERYPEFMPNVREVEIIGHHGDATIANYTLKLPLGFIKKYRLKLWSERTEKRIVLHWQEIPWAGLKKSETLVDTSGYWLLRPSTKDGYVVARYHAYTDPGKIPTGFGWIVNSLTKDSLPKLMKATRERIEALYYSKPK